MIKLSIYWEGITILNDYLIIDFQSAMKQKLTELKEEHENLREYVVWPQEN